MLIYGGTARIRTENWWIMSPLLYHLTKVPVTFSNSYYTGFNACNLVIWATSSNF